MILIVGLGNPGPEYSKTRHNVGFMLIDRLKNSNFTDVSSAKFQGELFKFQNLLFLKPTTFIVIHDDLDLNFGVVKFKKGGGNGGHNGLKSIDALMGADYERVRIGIGRSAHKGESAVTGHVLGEFNAEEKEGLEKILDYCENALNELIKTDIDAVSQKFSTKKGIL